MTKEHDGNIHQTLTDIGWQHQTENEITVYVINHPNADIGYYDDDFIKYIAINDVNLMNK